jgi:hypothetical protein
MPRLAEEYRRLSPTPDKFETFSAEIGQMWATQPRWSEADLARHAAILWRSPMATTKK